jgi:transcriptional regulator with PAS, ATPase and Fis domain
MSRWVLEFPAEVVVTDTTGIIIEMNKEAEALFAEDGGSGLLGSNVLDCHPDPSRKKLEHIMDRQVSNAYLNTESGETRFFFQAPWKKDGQYAGFVEISFVVSDEIPHFIRG